MNFMINDYDDEYDDDNDESSDYDDDSEDNTGPSGNENWGPEDPPT